MSLDNQSTLMVSSSLIYCCRTGSLAIAVHDSFESSQCRTALKVLQRRACWTWLYSAAAGSLPRLVKTRQAKKATDVCVSARVTMASELFSRWPQLYERLQL